jgi:hypothetical protein
MNTKVLAVDDEAESILRNIREAISDMRKRGEDWTRDANPDMMPILYVDTSMAVNRHVHEVLKDANFPLVIVETFEDLQAAMRERRIEPPLSMEKLTAMAQGMRSDVRFPNLAEVVNAMPALKLLKSETKTSKRPALPQNRKRDRWN